jgi:ComF family protein
MADLMPVEVAGGIRAVVPVPLHRNRLSSRGFNQAELLARWMADRLGVPCIAGALRRVQQEVAQEALGVEARRRNVLGAFAPGRGSVRGRILLVDDVFSTGATAAACSRVLRGMGAEAVVVYTLARALPRADIRGGPWIGRPTAAEGTMLAPEEGRGHGAPGGRA